MISAEKTHPDAGKEDLAHPFAAAVFLAGLIFLATGGAILGGVGGGLLAIGAWATLAALVESLEAAIRKGRAV